MDFKAILSGEKKPIPKAATPRDVVFLGGKYKGKTIGELIDSEDNEQAKYLMWYMSNTKSEYMKKNIRLAIDEFLAR